MPVDFVVYHIIFVPMQQENKRYYELAEKWLNGTITKEEMSEFSEWYNKNNDDFIVNIPEEFVSSEEALRKRIFYGIQNRQKQTGSVVSRRKYLVNLAAACVILLGSALMLFYLVTDKATPAGRKTPVSGMLKKDSILPGGNKAKLILADGTEVILDTARSGTIGGNGDAKVIKLSEGLLSCASPGDKHAPASYSTLSTPRGGQYAITLHDGTKVWLNSASSLRFPSSFSESERVVELTGEGYFEVSHQSRPFKVKVGEMEIKVLGTQFNIMAYRDEVSVNTTLLEGSVLISTQNENALLKPGEQAQVKPNSKIGVIAHADVEQAIAWKNGVFNFNGSDIETTMRQIARWYDIEVIHETQITEHFNGTIPRNVGIEKVLQLLEYTGVVHFQIQGRKIIVRS